jgi:hypothetical protein
VQTELWFVWRKSDDLYEARINTVLKDVDMNFRRMVETLNKSARQSLEQYKIVQQLFVALLAFSLMDRLLGNEWSVTAMGWVKDQFWGEWATQNPMLWLLVGLFIWLIIILVEERRLSTKKTENETGWATTKVVLKQPINLDALDDFLAYRKIIAENVEYTSEYAIVRSTWREPKRILGDPWGGFQPEVTLEYDDDNGYVFSAYIKYNTIWGKHPARDLKDILTEELVEANVIPPPGGDEEEEDIPEP